MPCFSTSDFETALLSFPRLLHAPFFLFADNVDLGTACGKYFRVSCLSIVDAGNALKDYYVLNCIFWHYVDAIDIFLIATRFFCVTGDSDIIKTVPGDH